ncbi:MAG: hypothetical protein AAF245_08015 [Pseudomonadota bacterium]
MRAVRATLVIGLILLLAACAVEEGATSVQIAEKRFVSSEQPYVEVVSMVDRRSERAAHTAMVINASQRVIYDPAGTFQHEDLVERGDIHYGATDRLVRYYERYHARFSHYVHVQRIPLSPEVAERVLRRAQAQGPSPKMFCAIHTVDVLNESLGTSFGRSFFPEALRTSVARMPGVIDRYRYEEDRTKAVPTDA